MKCPICGDETKLIQSRTIKIYKCLHCGLGKTENLLPQKGDYHRDETYIEEEALFKNIFQKRVRKILDFQKKGKVLEVGCSTGLMLSLFQKDNWETLGVEISTDSADVARKRGIRIIDEDFISAKFTEKFDVIIFNHTLEHLEDPIKTVKKTKELLASGGLLYIDVPNFGGLTANILKGYWPMLLPKEHLWHFTEKSLNILLTKLGFKIIFVEKASGIWDYDNPLMGILISFLTLKKRFFKEVVTTVPTWILTKLGIGSDLMIIAKKI